ncbi:ABC transporter substrate-binding protein [Candidatus Gracilibacteria bacterium]|nr:ABC transporter substrate-binding protein [Candidatus Gracilibacteria bacterium]
MKKILLGFGFGLLFFGCQSSPISSPQGDQTSPLRIGAIAPLSGEVASLGITLQNVTNMEVEQINQEGGIKGRPLEVVWEDGKCDPAQASRATQKLTGVDKVTFILAEECSGGTLGAAPITEKRKVVLLSPVSTSPEITHAGDFVFRTAPSDSSQGKALANYANTKFKKIGMLVEQVDYAVALARVFEDNFNGEVVREDFTTTESDFKTRITKLKNSDIEALFLDTNVGPKFEIITKQLQEQNWEKPVFTNEAAPGLLETTLKYADFFLKHDLVSSNFVAPENTRVQNIVAIYEQKFGEKPNYINYIAATLDSIDVMKYVLEQATDPTNAEEIRDILYATKDFPGIYGSLSFDENGDVNITHSLFKFDGEKFIPVSDEQ